MVFSDILGMSQYLSSKRKFYVESGEEPINDVKLKKDKYITRETAKHATKWITNYANRDVWSHNEETTCVSKHDRSHTLIK